MRSPRRYYLLKLLSARQLGREEGVWISKLLDYPGTVALPADFPSRTALVAAGYTTVDDVDGATLGELRMYARISPSAASAVIAAVAAL